MFVLSRNSQQRIIIGRDKEIIVQILNVAGDRVRLGISAPRSIPVHREEVLNRLKKDSSCERRK
jgi:carbon storage regulator